MKIRTLFLTILLFATGASAAESQNPSVCNVRFFSYVDPDTMEGLLSKVEDPLICADDQRLILTIQTPGGDVDSGMFVYDTLRLRESGVDTHVQHSAESMGVILFLAGDNRTMSSGARLLVHEVTFYAEGAIEPDKLREFAEGLEIAHDDYAAIVSERTGLPLDRVEALMINHTYLDAQEALALGFATAITDQ